jgi:hypothetical protein
MPMARVTPQDRAPVVNVNMFCRLVSQFILSREAYVMIRLESLDAKGQWAYFCIFKHSYN